jgi:hypothetical protein
MPPSSFFGDSRRLSFGFPSSFFWVPIIVFLGTHHLLSNLPRMVSRVPLIEASGVVLVVPFFHAVAAVELGVGEQGVALAGIRVKF